LVVSYAIGGMVMFFIMRALGELLLYRPVSGSFATYAEEFVGPWAGFITGWSYWFMWVVIGMAEITAVGDAAHAVIRDAQEAGVWVFAGGVYPHNEVSVSVVAPDGTVTDGPESKAYIAGVTIIDVPSRDEALQWAAKIAVACRCAQEVREFAPDPAVGN